MSQQERVRERERERELDFIVLSISAMETQEQLTIDSEPRKFNLPTVGVKPILKTFIILKNWVSLR